MVTDAIKIFTLEITLKSPFFKYTRDVCVSLSKDANESGSPPKIKGIQVRIRQYGKIFIKICS